MNYEIIIELYEERFARLDDLLPKAPAELRSEMELEMKEIAEQIQWLKSLQAL